jgi:hypothetical protein
MERIIALDAENLVLMIPARLTRIEVKPARAFAERLAAA